MIITSRFDNNCSLCGDTAWAGEKVYYNAGNPKGQKIRHERCGDFEDVVVTLPAPVGEKPCTKCGEVKPLNEYNRKARHPDGLQYWCRPCDNAYNREYHRKRRADIKIGRKVSLSAPTPFADELSTTTGIEIEALRKMTIEQVEEYLQLQARLNELKVGTK